MQSETKSEAQRRENPSHLPKTDESRITREQISSGIIAIRLPMVEQRCRLDWHLTALILNVLIHPAEQPPPLSTVVTIGSDSASSNQYLP